MYFLESVPTTEEFYLLGSRLAEAILLLVIGAALGVAAQWAVDKLRRRTEDYELWADTLSSSLKPQLGDRTVPLAYTVGDEKVADPQLVEFFVWSSGRKDVEASMFNGGDVIIDLGVPILHVDSDGVDDKSEDSNFELQLAAGRFVLSPSIVRRRFVYYRRLITDGAPRISFTNKVANLELDSYFQSWQRPTRPRTVLKVLARIAFVLAALIVVGGILGLIAGLALTGERDSVGYLLVAMLLATPLTIAGIILSTLHDAPGRRLGHARKILRQRLPRALAWETYEHTGDPLGDTRFPRHGRVEAAG